MRHTPSPPRIDPRSGLTEKQAWRLRAILENHREIVQQRLEAYREDLLDCAEPLSDDLDLASRQQDQVLLLRLAENERSLLGEIAHALRKLDDGSYGLCERTGEPIGLRRLRARPWTRYSIGFQALLERNRTSARLR